MYTDTENGRPAGLVDREEAMPPLRTLIDDYLDAQRRLQTPVALLAREYDRGPDAILPQHIPLTAPAAGEQYAFEVDLDACTGCKACVAACHSLNGLDEHEAWRDVGLILSPAPTGYAQTVTTACHHCADPGCMHGCPVRAYEKDPATGIVRHLDDQCIGCSYCILKCPYDVPKYNDRLGIVRKCDLCHGRLAAGEAPACVQACPTHAIKVVTVATATPNPSFLPAAPEAAWTQPTTRYVSRRPVPKSARAADALTATPEPGHMPLVLMLVGTQVSVGALIAGSIWLALFVAVAGLAASVFHLGQPFRAWRAFLGLRRSWLSREILVFGLYPPLLAAALWPPFSDWAVPGATTVGLVGVFCSMMIYADTPRWEWRFVRTMPIFAGTVVLSVLAIALVLNRGHSPELVAALVAVTLTKLGFERMTQRDERSARLRDGALRRMVATRTVLAMFGGVFLPIVAILDPASAFGCTAIAGVALIAAEFAERMFYFRSVSPSKMPGVSAS